MSIDPHTLASLPDWRLLSRALHARFATGNFAAGLEFVQAVGAAAEAVDHHPDVVLQYPFVEIRLMSHDVHEVTDRDVRLAGTISQIAADQGVLARPEAVSLVELSLDTWNLDEIMPFWQAVVGITVDPACDIALVDKAGLLPGMWFQTCEPHDEPPQRFHYDVWVPADQAEARIAAAIAAGGRMVSDAEAPSFWVLADAQGNKACICTHLDRD